ncbi:hypothetical protein G9A89_005861 [Geosiphon pyriformis]|nr:hypothetical protein G9A89_005861 [Geosiphon pyriformis]
MEVDENGQDTSTLVNGDVDSRVEPQPLKEGVTGFVYDPRMRFHGNIHEDDHHPEDPGRISGITKILEKYKCLDKLVKISARQATKEEICLVHTPEHWNTIQKTADMSDEDLIAAEDEYNSVYLNNDTAFCARLSCGGVIELCKAVISGKVSNGFANVRPPGHHAEPDEAMGFCLFNNVAVAAKCLRNYHNVERIFILDWDIHHGNGTQKAFYDDPNVVYCSIHRYEDGEFYPGNKSAHFNNVGEGVAKGKTINIPWPRAEMCDSDYIYAFNKVVMPIAYEFAPNLVIVSAGFDAAEGDPIGENHVTPTAFGHMTHLLKSLAGGKLVLALEGGYNLESITQSALACVKVLLGESPASFDSIRPSKDCVETIHHVVNTQSRYWKSLAPQFLDIGEERTPGKIVIDMSEMLKAYRARYLYDKFRMVPAPISNDRLNSKFFNQVTCSQDLFQQNILFLFVHDMADFRAETKAMTNSINITKSYMIDTSQKFIDTITKQDCALIDVDVPPLLGDIRLRPDLNELLLYIWDNIIVNSQAKQVFLLGAGVGCPSIAHLITEREPLVIEKVTGVIMIANEVDMPKVGRGVNLHNWYFDHTFNVVPQSNPYWEKKDRTKSKAFGKCILPARFGNAPIEELLHHYHQEIFRFVYNSLAGRQT